MVSDWLPSLIYIDRISQLMMMLITFITGIVACFSRSYLQGDTLYLLFFKRLVLLYICLIIMVSTNNTLILASAWSISSWLLSLLMLYKRSWKASVASYTLARNNFILGSAALFLACFGFYKVSSSFCITTILNNSYDPSFIFTASLGFLLVVAFTQSALWPFHTWLLSSLNSPTPVSALMHAGLVNAGGFLLMRFAPLFFPFSKLLTYIFMVGFISACLGSVYKLIQSDVKRMLACSTLGQMGFMMMQIGSGLYAAAMTHIIFHGIFKAYLFLSCVSTAQEKRLVRPYKHTRQEFIWSLLAGVLSSFIFTYVQGKAWITTDTNFVLTLVTGIAGIQCALTLASNKRFIYYPFILFVTSLLAGLYAVVVHTIESFLPSYLHQPQPLTFLHYAALFVFIAGWMISNRFAWYLQRYGWYCAIRNYLYVVLLNASQPHPTTITADRKEYKHV